ncbi:hypothetical protein SO802_028807 [Lithocarpus litseifolius]|uniref:Late embryogenesis abundant protein n=1 Tax=Lithocarpus litseifolius TaxID=425828 RepID=A0AAW2BSA3_9ROSI
MALRSCITIYTYSSNLLYQLNIGLASCDKESGGMSKANILLLREAKGVGRHFSKLAGAHRSGKSRQAVSSGVKIDDSSCWIPHPRTGIYFPQGHDWVMDDVREGAASFNQNYWMRDVDGVEKRDASIPPDQYYTNS